MLTPESRYMNPKISSVHAREVLDSRGNPTIEVELTLSDGSMGRGIVPSGASKGEHEAIEIRDNDPKRFLGKGTLKAVQNVRETIGRQVLGKHFATLQELDRVLLSLDGTAQKSTLGANAIVGVSVAFAVALSNSRRQPLFQMLHEWMSGGAGKLSLPIPQMNILNGGLHANNDLEFQEFMIVPHGFSLFSEALRAGCEVFHHLKRKLASLGLSTAVGDEGGFAPNVESNEKALDLICEAIASAGYAPGKQISLALDIAASSFYNAPAKNYIFRYQGGPSASRGALLEYYGELLNKFPIVSIEDGLEENDWPGWKNLTQKLSDKTQLVGDDLFVTDKNRVQRGIHEKIANAVLIKINQIGTLSETFDTMALARKNNYRCVVSHRSGETEDVTIAHLAVGSGCGQIKTGSLSRSERTAKYNELLRIEEWGKRNGREIPFAKVF